MLRSSSFGKAYGFQTLVESNRVRLRWREVTAQRGFGFLAEKEGCHVDLGIHSIRASVMGELEAQVNLEPLGIRKST